MKCEGFGKIILRIFIIYIYPGQVGIHIYGFDDVRRSNYFGENEVTEEMIKGRGDLLADTP